jgi:hypothetical protein
MRRALWLLMFVALSVIAAFGQRSLDSAPLYAEGCGVVTSRFGPITCPNGAACGSYYTFQTDPCNIDNGAFCAVLQPISTCCQKYHNYVPNGPCGFADLIMHDPRVRSRILELAKDNEILIPTCSGAYIPARIAFREYKNRQKDNGGL